MTYHCSHLDHDRGTVAVCPELASVVWRGQDGVAHGYCLEHTHEGHLEAIAKNWSLEESSRAEGVAA